MIFKEWLRFIYGMAMGTSVAYIKPSKRFMWPTALKEIDKELNLFLGGSCVCGILHDGKQSVLINTNSGEAAGQLIQYVEKEIHELVPVIFGTSVLKDFIGGNKLYSAQAKFYLPESDDKSLRAEWPDFQTSTERISSEKEFRLAGEDIVVIPVKLAASKCDLAIYLKSRKILFLGGLFYNHIHPVLRPLDGMNIANWIKALEDLVARFQPTTFVPAEGDLGDNVAIEQFISYLKALSNPKFEFSECRKTYDWMEIPGQTSLEENFDLIRENTKSFTKF